MSRSGLLRAAAAAAVLALPLGLAAGTAQAATGPTAAHRTATPAASTRFVPTHVNPDTGSYQGYIMVDAYSRLCLDANAAGLATNGDQLTIENCDGASNQLWTENVDANDYETVVNAADGKCLDANAAGLTTNGDPVQLWDCTGASNQEWQGSDYYNIASGKYLTANAPTGWVGAPVVLWDELGTYTTPYAGQWWNLFTTF